MHNEFVCFYSFLRQEFFQVCTENIIPPNKYKTNQCFFNLEVKDLQLFYIFSKLKSPPSHQKDLPPIPSSLFLLHFQWHTRSKTATPRNNVTTSQTIISTGKHQLDLIHAESKHRLQDCKHYYKLLWKFLWRDAL